MNAHARAQLDSLADVMAHPDGQAELHALLAPLLPGPEAERAPFYTVARLSEQTGLSPKAIRNAIARGELAAVKRGGQWIIHARAADAYGAPTQAKRGSAGGRHARATQRARPSLGAVFD